MAHKNAIPYFITHEGRKIQKGTRVRIKSRHGSTGTGTVTEVLCWVNAPDTICVEMDADAVYAPMEKHQPRWNHDSERIRSTGVFGGEIVEVLTMH